MQRYSVIQGKNSREIVLLRGTGCRYRRCAFCDYHQDASKNEAENLTVNRRALAQVKGTFGVLEVINSGSFGELEDSTMNEILSVCRNKKIRTVHFECHYLYRHAIPALRERFMAIGVTVKVKQGVETFDADYREKVMKKGIPETDPLLIAKDFDECCLLFGLSGQTAESMKRDIETGLSYFERVCVNVMTENSAELKPDETVRRIFIEEVYPVYRSCDRVDILLHNTDFGVGGEENEKQ